jgi:hypothetical protein
LPIGRHTIARSIYAQTLLWTLAIAAAIAMAALIRPFSAWPSSRFLADAAVLLVVTGPLLGPIAVAGRLTKFGLQGTGLVLVLVVPLLLAVEDHAGLTAWRTIALYTATLAGLHAATYGLLRRPR